MKASHALRLGILAAALCGCPSEPEPVVPPPPKPAPPPPPPSAPKCEAMKDQCKAKADTEVPIPGADWLFMPPESWIYAKLEEASVTENGEDGAVLLFASYEPDKQNPKRAKQRVDLVTSLAELVGITPPSVGSLASPDLTSTIGGLKMAFWEKPGAKRGNAAGGLLILEADVDGRALFGIGFAPANDQEGTDAIKSTINTLKKKSGAGK
jgi:hypothetical protein